MTEISRSRGKKKFWGRITIGGTKNYSNIAIQAEQILVDFFDFYVPIKNKRAFFFNIKVQEEPDFYYHNDNFHAYHGPNISLRCDLDFDKFELSSEEEKLGFIMSACFLLLEHWYNFYQRPKDFDLLDLIEKFKKFIQFRNTFIGNKDFFIKPYDNITFQFVTTTGAGAVNTYYDLNNIQYFLNKKLNQFKFGDSVHRFQFGHELFSRYGDVAYPLPDDNNFMLYGKDWRRLVVARFFNSDIMKNQTPLEQLVYLQERINSGIDLLKSFKKLPKNFDIGYFQIIVNQSLNEYIQFSVQNDFDNEKLKKIQKIIIESRG
jgi:hypothetical protein